MALFNNDVPLDFNYFKRLDKTLELIALGNLESIENLKKGIIFEEAEIFQKSDVRIAITPNEVTLLKDLV